MLDNASSNIEIDLKIRLIYLAIYNKDNGQLVYYDKNKLVFDEYSQLEFYTESIKEKLERDNNIKCFKTIVHEEYPVKFIRGKDNTTIFISEITCK